MKIPLLPQGRIVTRRAQVRRRLSAIEAKRLLTCKACLARIDPAARGGAAVAGGRAAAALRAVLGTAG